MKILITGGTGMFGGTLLRELAGQSAPCNIRALVRNMEKARSSGIDALRNVEMVVGDMLEPATLDRALNDVDRIFLVSPMSPVMDTMEINVIQAAKRHHGIHVFKLYGAVKHEGRDLLSQLHDKSLEALKQSGLPWTCISPNSVMETVFLNPSSIAGIKDEHALYGCTGRHRVGFVALRDVVTAAARIVTTDDHAYKDYLLTGPEALSLFDAAGCFSRALGKEITYHDYPEEEFTKLMIGATGMPEEQLEMIMLCHLKAWNRDGADLVTATFEGLTGKKPTGLESWIQAHKRAFM